MANLSKAFRVFKEFIAMETNIESTYKISPQKLFIWTCLVVSATSAAALPPLPDRTPSPKYAVAAEDLNEHCFTQSEYGKSNDYGDLERHCLPGYRKGTEDKPCPNRTCCPCEEWTYQPKFNFCEDCVAKTYCPDEGKKVIVEFFVETAEELFADVPLPIGGEQVSPCDPHPWKFESFGNITTNSKCGEDIELTSIPTEGLSTMDLVTVRDGRDESDPFKTTLPQGQEDSFESIHTCVWTFLFGITLILLMISVFCNFLPILMSMIGWFSNLFESPQQQGPAVEMDEGGKLMKESLV